LGWYEWLAIVRSRRHPVVVREAGSAQGPRESESSLPALWIIYVSSTLPSALAIQLPAPFEYLGRGFPTPAQSSFLPYILLFLVCGGMAGGILLKNPPVALAGVVRTPVRRHVLCTAPALPGQRSTWSCPEFSPRNEWAQAFLWIREQTPVDALFALDPAT